MTYKATQKDLKTLRRLTDLMEQGTTIDLDLYREIREYSERRIRVLEHAVLADMKRELNEEINLKGKPKAPRKSLKKT
jgi:hypothetical protein